MLRKAYLGLRALCASLFILALVPACLFDNTQNGPSEPSSSSDSCSHPQGGLGVGSNGTGRIFLVDPKVASGDPLLAPGSSLSAIPTLDVELQRLKGEGILSGQYVDIRVIQENCFKGHGAFSASNQFTYNYGDRRFQEVMSYYYGDRFRHYLDQQGYLAPQPVVKIISHCGLMDNAYYNSLSNEVCLGDSFQSLDSFYADDSAVNLHEIQHGTTIDLYKGATGDYFNHFFADESGALNEAISDFMSMAFVARDVSAPNDPRDFSRWALQSFMSQDASRGAHLCPRYDSAFPDCTSYENGAVGFSADLGHVSYAYPDGLGWPFGRNMSGPGYLKNAFENFRDQEEIHNLAVIATGALWDGFEALREIDDDETALALMTRAVMEAIVHLPPPSDDLKAPITFIRFFDLMVQWAEVVGFSVQQKNALIAAFEKRGLYQFTSLPSDWGSVGAGASSSPGMKIEDHPNLVKNWIFATGGDPSAVTHSLGTGLNGRLSPGEMVAIWFDIQNNSALTAGSTLIRVRSDHPAIELFNQNIGYVSANAASVPEVQMRYYKINGTEVVSRLSSANPSLHVPTGNSYFKTNPFFYLSPRTAIFIKVSSTAVEGDRIPFQVVVQPENGPEIELIYEAEVDGA